MVDKPDSFIHYGFSTFDYNIGFSIERLGKVVIVDNHRREAGNIEIVPYELVDSHIKPITGVIAVSEPGVYKLVWHNHYSYLNSKVVKYKFRVFSRKLDKSLIEKAN